MAKHWETSELDVKKKKKKLKFLHFNKRLAKPQNFAKRIKKYH